MADCWVYNERINKVLGHLNKGKKPFAVSLFLLVILMVLGAVYQTRHGQSVVGRGILGGPEDRFFRSYAAGITLAFADGRIVSNLPPDNQPAYQVAADRGILMSSLSEDNSPPGFADREGLFIYKVRKGDTPSGIASYFGISLDTLVNANPSIRTKLLRAGDELNILPTSGIVYHVRDNDTLESISSYFGVSEGNIVKFNKSVNPDSLGAGISLVIPGARSSASSQGGGSLPNFNVNFIRPADGFNWGVVHHYNAVDIAAACGTPVVSAAEGLVLPDESFGDGGGGWNAGYGNFVLIEHLFGDNVRTRYAHLEKVLVGIGDYVKQGQQIGTMGETGDATGCHVHFEVYGAQNPLGR